MADEDHKSLIGQILAYVDRPWRVIAIVVLFLVGGAGYALYQQREEIIEAWLTPDTLALKTGDVTTALEKLTEDTDADLIQIWAVDLSSNSQRFLAARRKDGERPFIPSPRRLPVIVTTSDVQSLVNVLNGHPACGDTADRPSPLMRRLVDRGMHRACAMPIPPSAEAFVGVIYLAWETKQDPSDEDNALVAAREVSKQLVKR